MSKSQLISPSPREHAIRSLRGLIERGGLREGDRLPAESKLAAQFDVSRMTVRKALDALERQGLVRRERNQGCILTGGSTPSGGVLSRTIVLVTDHGAASDGEVFSGNSPAIVSGVIARISTESYNFLRVAPTVDDASWLSELIAAGVPGFIVSCWSRPVEWQIKVLAQLRASGLPVVAYGDTTAFDPYDHVSSDHVSGAAKLVRALAGAGCKHTLRLWTVPDTMPWIQAHNDGYDAAVRDLGLPTLPPVYVDALPDRGNGAESLFRARVRHLAGYLVEHLQPAASLDAIMVATDCEALVALAACRLFGRQDVRVTGYDNYWREIEERQYEASMPFATVDKNNHRLGEELATLLLQRMRGELPSSPQQRLLEQELVLTEK
jgi:DNA-binding LacI/PurR family transcriptional regulator